MAIDDYDWADDGHKSYLYAIEMKRLRGDRHWPEYLDGKNEEGRATGVYPQNDPALSRR